MLCNEGGDTQRISAVRESILTDGSPPKLVENKPSGKPRRECSAMTIS